MTVDPAAQQRHNSAAMVHNSAGRSEMTTTTMACDNGEGHGEKAQCDNNGGRSVIMTAHGAMTTTAYYLIPCMGENNLFISF